MLWLVGEGVVVVVAVVMVLGPVSGTEVSDVKDSDAGTGSGIEKEGFSS